MGSKTITVVAGFGRCGSSLVMQMLAAGGMPTPYSSYPSYEITKGTPMVMGELYGGAVKILDPHVNRPPRGPDYRFIWLDRDPVQQSKSMAKFWKAAMVDAPSNLPPFPEFTEEQIVKLADAFRRDRPRANAVMREYTQKILKMRFEAILHDPAWAAHLLKGFCGPLDEKAMAAAVQPRGPECLPYMLELEQLEEVNHG